MYAFIMVPLAVLAVGIAVVPVFVMSVREHRRLLGVSDDLVGGATLTEYRTRPTTKARPASRVAIGGNDPIRHPWVESDNATAVPREARPLVGAR
jgi:hypothetical protein